VEAQRQEIERVLETRGRKTPTLIKAPNLQWDMTKPFTPSMSTLRSKCSSPLSAVEDEEDEEDEEEEESAEEDRLDGDETVEHGTCIFPI
jgi:hypothetical protein